MLFLFVSVICGKVRRKDCLVFFIVIVIVNELIIEVYFIIVKRILSDCCILVEVEFDIIWVNGFDKV